MSITPSLAKEVIHKIISSFSSKSILRQVKKKEVSLLLVLESLSGTLLGETLVTDELRADSLQVGVTLGLHLLDTIAVSLLVY